ncbi:hypothetical protein Ccl03g_33840 [Enterocloster clostridioformis]|uniref:Uncharacterized protein n=1 Tax=Enterocloster clostridioformis TaxID=1531 RepID=A0A829WDJ7_9FIRM|nr:hypothetical protein Ccl03g_33840 [Enterocloster clostridioformis]
MYNRNIVLKNLKEWIEYCNKIQSNSEKPYSEDIIEKIFSLPFEFDTIPI